MQYAENYESPRQTKEIHGVKGVFASLSPKSSFFFGLVGGMMFLFSVGFFVLLGVYLDGGFPEKTKTANTNTAPSVAGANANANRNTAPTAPAKVNFTITDQDHVRGKADAKVTIVEYTDFQCPYCQTFHETMLQLLKNYPNDVRWVLRNFPLSFHPEAEPAAIAAECALEQKDNDTYWKYVDKLFENQSQLGSAQYETWAKELGLNLNTFKDCVSNKKTLSKIQKQSSEGAQYGVQGTPGNYLNGTELGGAVPYSSLEAQVKQIIGK